jgi:hypothetical protein
MFERGIKCELCESYRTYLRRYEIRDRKTGELIRVTYHGMWYHSPFNQGKRWCNKCRSKWYNKLPDRMEANRLRNCIYRREIKKREQVRKKLHSWKLNRISKLAKYGKKPKKQKSFKQ